MHNSHGPESLPEYPQYIRTANTQELDRKYDVNAIDIAPGHNCLPQSLNNAEFEDLAARMIRMAKFNEGKFVAPCRQSIAEEICREIEARSQLGKTRTDAIRERHEIEFQRSMAPMWRRMVAALLPLDIISDAAREKGPARKEPLSPESERAVSSVLSMKCGINPGALNETIDRMCEEGYLKVEKMDGNVFLEPTAKMIHAILDAQRKRQK